MDHLRVQLHKHILEINDAAEILSRAAQKDHVVSIQDQAPQYDTRPMISGQPSQEVRRARQSILANTTLIQHMLRDPSDFLQQLSFQTQLLACLQWLGDFQILAFVPIDKHVSFEDVAHLAGVPQGQLTRVVRITATAGFLCEPGWGRVAHSPLSAQFVLQPSLLDAIMFISEVAAPTALQMALTTREYGDSQRPNETAYNVAFKNSPPFAAMCEQRTKLRRQSGAFSRLGKHDEDRQVVDLLGSLRFATIGGATVVDVGAQSVSTASALADISPSLQFIVQICSDSSNRHTPPFSISQYAGEETSLTLPNGTNLADPMETRSRPRNNTHIAIQKRALGTPQTVEGAAIYIMRLPSPSAAQPQHQILTRIAVELRAHLNVLRKTPTSILIVVARMATEPGTLDPSIEATARSCDMLLHQLTNQKELGMEEVIEIVSNIKDGAGRLVLIRKRIDRHNPFIALEIGYKAHPDRSANGSKPAFWTLSSTLHESTL